MSNAIDNLQTAFKKALTVRPKVGGFPHLAEVLRQAGVTRNVWSLPACQSLYETNLGPVISQEPPLVAGMVDVPPFDQAALVKALRTDQAGESTFAEFLQASWNAGVIGYDVDFNGRTVTYRGANGEAYVESYPEVSLDSN